MFGQNGTSTAGSWSSVGLGGVNGNGGTKPGSGGAGGGGFFTDGQGGNSYGGGGGKSFLNGGEGGINKIYSGSMIIDVQGGFGGGAGAGTHQNYESNAGGGGGYSGGGGSNSRLGAGGGGGNYYIGDFKSSGYNTGNGFVSFVLLDVTDVPEPSTFAIFALGMIGLASRRFKKQS